MKKLGLSIVPASLLVLSPNAFANEPEATDLSIGMAVDQQLSVVVELDSSYRFTIGNDGAAFDYILQRGEFEGNTPVSWYVGVGGWSEWEGKEFGARVPLGLKWDISRGWRCMVKFTLN